MEACSIGGVIAISFAQLWFEAALILGHVCGPQLSVDAVLSYGYTGGITKALSCVQITHRMALHEVEAHPCIVELQRSDRVLQQHSMFWAASTHGEIDIALAFGCALVFCETWDTDTLVNAIREGGVTCEGGASWCCCHQQ